MWRQAHLTPINIEYVNIWKKKCSTDVVKDSDFKSCLDLFKAKVIDLKKSGQGSVDHKPPMAEHDLQALYRADNVALNINTPSGLQSKVWFDIMFYFCRRGQENLCDMTKSTFWVVWSMSTRLLMKRIKSWVSKFYSSLLVWSYAPVNTCKSCCEWSSLIEP